MKYFLTVEIEPVKHYIHVIGRIQNPTNQKFYLNKNFNIINISSKGQKIEWYMDKTQPHPAFDIVSRPVILDFIYDEIDFEYDGYISEIIADINQIDEDIIELSSYSGWYLKPESMNERFSFELNIIIPDGYEIASNGVVIDYQHISSVIDDSDIAIFASNKVKRYEYNEKNIKCTILCSQCMHIEMDKRVEELTEANKIFTKLYGEINKEDKKTEIISIFRPRGGWAYKRGNVTFNSAEYNSEEEKFKVDFHELAHGWWSIANITTDDWINEGGAEFSAYVAAKNIYGNEYAENYIVNCIKLIEQATENSSIVDTNYESTDRYLNHYIKTTMMFINAQKVFGENRVYNLLSNFYSTYKMTQDATTLNFLALCDNEMRAFFEKYLYIGDWSKIEYKI